MHSPNELRRAIMMSSEHLVRTQGELSELLRRASSPLLEVHDEGRRRTLERQRDALLDRWCRLCLCWLLQGGDVELIERMEGQIPA